MSGPGYVRHYDVNLLDDLHNYFPELLYGPAEQFASVGDVLRYVRGQVRRRFDLFSSGQANFHSAAGAGGAPPAAPAPAPAPVTPFPSTQTSPSLFRATNAASDRLRNILREEIWIERAAPVPPPLPRVLAEPGGQSAIDLLSVMLGMGSLNSVTNVPLPNPNAMDPVIVRPTTHEINRATLSEIMDAGEGEVCAICQDEMPAGSSVCTISHCDHRFHEGCLMTWFERSVRCPVCRHDIRDMGAEMTSVD